MCLMGIECQESAAGKHIDYRVEERLRGGIGFEDLAERNIWPSAESDLRRAPTSARPAAHFDAAWDNEVGRVEGYRLAAEVLVRHMVRHRGDRDFLIYPFARGKLLTRLQVLVGPIGALGRCHLFRVRHERRVRTTDGALLGSRPALADRHLAALPVRVAQLTVRSPANTPELTRP